MDRHAYKEEFDQLTFDEKMNSIHRDGIYLMSRKVRGYYINLYSLFSNYVEAWYTEATDEVCRIELLKDEHSLDIYLSRIKLLIFEKR